MSDRHEYIEQLVFKFNTGNISQEEFQVLLDWYNEHDDQEVVIRLRKHDSYETLKSRMFTNLMDRIMDERPQPSRRFPRLKWIASAAAILLVAAGLWITFEYKAAKSGGDSAAGIEPGGNKATLTLSDGRRIALSSSQPGIVSGNRITYTNGAPVENALPDQSQGTRQSMILQTPRGGTYKLVLPDGSEVWLNAASTLKYPSQFEADKRIVELEGEAYFHIKHLYRKQGENIPFKVISNQQVVDVLGTQFNISAYPGSDAVKTTLVEGKVAVTSPKKRFILTPNEQAVTTAATTTVSLVNAGNYIAWRDGKFSFDNKTFKETMDEIGRWYDLDVDYENGIPDEELAGDAYRSQNIHFVLRLLDVAEIDYRLDAAHRKLTIKGKKNRF